MAAPGAMFRLKFLIILFLLQPTSTDDINLISINDGPGMVPFKLGSARIISYYHSFLVNGNLQASTIISIYDKLNEMSSNHQLLKPHLIHLKNKLYNWIKLLETFKINRDKNITDNLEYSDAVIYNEFLKSHQDNEVNHISLIKNWDSQYSKAIDTTVENLNKLDDLINDGNFNNTMTYADVNYTLAVDELRVKLSDNIDSITSELNKLLHGLAFIANSTKSNKNPRVDGLGFTSGSLPDMKHQLATLYGRDKILQLNDSEYFAKIIRGFYYLNDKLVIVYKFPIISENIYDYYKLPIVPNKNHEILVPPYPYALQSEKDFKYIEAECPKTSRGYLCDGQKYLHNQSSPDCIQQLIQTQQRTASCNPVPASLEKPAYEALDSKTYTISFPMPTEVHFSCGIVNEHALDFVKTLQGSYRAVIPDHCYIKTPQFVIPNKNDRVSRQAPISLNMNNISANDSLVLKTDNLLDLHSIYSGVYVKPPLKQDDDTSHQSTTSIISICVALIIIVIIGSLILTTRYIRKRRQGTYRYLGPYFRKRLRSRITQNYI